jgi:hypothetical protein
MLDDGRRRLDVWLERHPDADVNAGDIQELAGLLQVRRDALTELAELDDSLLTYLLKQRRSGAEQGGRPD